MPNQKFLRRTEVETRTGLPRSTIYQQIEEGSFPKPVRISPRLVGWVEAEISAWQEAKIVERDTGQGSLLGRKAGRRSIITRDDAEEPLRQLPVETTP